MRFCDYDERLSGFVKCHYGDVIMSEMAYQIIGVSIIYSTACSGASQRKHYSSTSLAFVGGIHRWPVSSPHNGPVTRKMFPFDDVIMFFSDSSHLLPVNAFASILLKTSCFTSPSIVLVRVFCCCSQSCVLNHLKPICVTHIWNYIFSLKLPVVSWTRVRYDPISLGGC